jgi:hypothetical protein
MGDARATAGDAATCSSQVGAVDRQHARWWRIVVAAALGHCCGDGSAANRPRPQIAAPPSRNGSASGRALATVSLSHVHFSSTTTTRIRHTSTPTRPLPPFFFAIHSHSHTHPPIRHVTKANLARTNTRTHAYTPSYDYHRPPKKCNLPKFFLPHCRPLPSHNGILPMGALFCLVVLFGCV